MARPGKRTPVIETAILDALRAGNTRTAAAGAVGIEFSTLYRWMQVDANFCNAIKTAEHQAELAHVANIAKAAKLGNWTASAWWLERRRHQEWGKVDRIEITLRQQAERLAAEQGLDAAELIAEAERIVAGGAT